MEGGGLCADLTFLLILLSLLLNPISGQNETTSNYDINATDVTSVSNIIGNVTNGTTAMETTSGNGTTLTSNINVTMETLSEAGTSNDSVGMTTVSTLVNGSATTKKPAKAKAPGVRPPRPGAKTIKDNVTLGLVTGFGAILAVMIGLCIIWNVFLNKLCVDNKNQVQPMDVRGRGPTRHVEEGAGDS